MLGKNNERESDVLKLSEWQEGVREENNLK